MWDTAMPFLMFAARVTVNESTGFSPFQLVFGHEGEDKADEGELEAGYSLVSRSVLGSRTLWHCGISRASSLI
ncbi:hypothetical protein SKAU_G00208670 [Synaphobranchus kaupii]|uniref:Uncharacterized protein n=1 Tax=Synaphobranchus kaupii TaxID=118154 RepID=A0A9Q1F8L5_SYNKA|nr:hypothetical protein SKAU_G00208670 [Synaphobranchus kaupii]